MPIYEYQCKACGHTMEALQKIDDSPLLQCPACHKPQLKKLISAVAFRLKGGGWYETDFKTGNKKNLAGDQVGKPDTTTTKTEAVKTDASSAKATKTDTSSASSVNKN